MPASRAVLICLIIKWETRKAPAMTSIRNYCILDYARETINEMFFNFIFFDIFASDGLYPEFRGQDSSFPQA